MELDIGKLERIISSEDIKVGDTIVFREPERVKIAYYNSEYKEVHIYRKSSIGWFWTDTIDNNQWGDMEELCTGCPEEMKDVEFGWEYYKLKQ